MKIGILISALSKFYYYYYYLLLCDMIFPHRVRTPQCLCHCKLPPNHSEMRRWWGCLRVVRGLWRYEKSRYCPSTSGVPFCNLQLRSSDCQNRLWRFSKLLSVTSTTISPYCNARPRKIPGWIVVVLENLNIFLYTSGVTENDQLKLH